MMYGNLQGEGWTVRSWGHPGRYYSVGAFKAGVGEKKDPASLARAREIEAFLNARDQEIPKKVERTFRQWNLIIRDYLRNETGLRLTFGDSTQSVPVRIIPGLPKPFDDFIADNNANLLMILLNKPAIINAAEGMAFFDEQFMALSKDCAPGPGR